MGGTLKFLIEREREREREREGPSRCVYQICIIYYVQGTAVAQWLICYARNRKVAGSIPAGVIGIFHSHKILPIALWPWDRLSL